MNYQLQGGMADKHDNFEVGSGFFQMGQGFQTVHAGHADVHQRYLEGLMFHHIHGRRDRRQWAVSIYHCHRKSDTGPRLNPAPGGLDQVIGRG